ncbi:MAG: serine kinase [Bacteroidales bacterium]|nr:serine kinase [Bacteroidales bacterium]
MKVKNLVEQMNLRVLAGEGGLDREVRGGYASDLLSDVMGNTDAGCVWLTLLTQKNAVAVAALKELACMVVVKGQQPDADALEMANEEQIPILSTPKQTFEMAGELYLRLKENQ